jgi:hypothetical protein
MSKPSDLKELWNNSIIQFGYIAFFSLAFPLAPLWGLIVNIFHLNMCFFSFYTHTQRPICLERGSVGIWNGVFFSYSLFALAFNTGILLFSSESMYQLLDYDMSSRNDAYRIAVILGIAENIVFLIKFVVSSVISDRPKWVKEEEKNRTKRMAIEEEKFKSIQHKLKVDKKNIKETIDTSFQKKETLYHRLKSHKKGLKETKDRSFEQPEFSALGKSA